MQIVFESAGFPGAPPRERVEARLRFALRRLSWLVPHARVRLSERDGARSAAAKHCHIELRVVGAGDVVVSAIARDWLDSIDDALRRASRLLARRHRQVHQQ